MAEVTLAEAKARLSELITRAEQGEAVRITRHGRLVAQLVPVASPRQRISAAELRELTDSMPWQEEPAAELIRRMRDSDRY